MLRLVDGIDDHITFDERLVAQRGMRHVIGGIAHVFPAGMLPFANTGEGRNMLHALKPFRRRAARPIIFDLFQRIIRSSIAQPRLERLARRSLLEALRILPAVITAPRFDLGRHSVVLSATTHCVLPVN